MKSSAAPGGGVVAEDREHRPLIAGAQVKKAVPGEDAVEALAKGQPAHVGYKPARVREAALAQRDHRGRGIDAGHAIARFDEGAGDRLARPATEVEHRPAARHEREEAVEPGPLEQLTPALRLPRAGVAVIEFDDPVGIVSHPLSLPGLAQ